MRWSWVVFALAGCESGLGVVVDLEVDADVSAAFSADAPGVLVLDAVGLVEVVAPLCGQRQPPNEFYEDLGFGCLEDSQKGAEEDLVAWVQPLPEGWDAERFCALDRSGSEPLSIPSDVTGAAADRATTTATTPVVAGGLASSPEPEWAQGQTVGTWRKVPICGGVLRGEPLVVSFR